MQPRMDDKPYADVVRELLAEERAAHRAWLEARKRRLIAEAISNAEEEAGHPAGDGVMWAGRPACSHGLRGSVAQTTDAPKRRAEG
jgi:hypothetical protein